MNDASAIYVIDDDPAISRLTRGVLSAEGFSVQCFHCGEDFLARELPQSPGCLITDLNLPGMSGAEVQDCLKQRGSGLSVIIISGVADVPIAVRVMKNGAVTILQKPYTPAALLDAVKQGLARSREVVQDAERIASVHERLTRLTDDERQVLKFLVQGMSNKVISSALVLSARTVDRRRQSVLQKMEVKTVQELAGMLARVDWDRASTSPTVDVRSALDSAIKPTEQVVGKPLE